jgi:mRNA interferase RelE/StbE
LPGPVRQRVRQAIDGLGTQPRPQQSRQLDVPATPTELRRLRIDRWRLIYAVSDDRRWVWVLAVRRRPPYDYEDLPALLARLADLRS